MIRRGDQFWNEDKTEGYEFVQPMSKGELLCCDHVKPIGSAPRPKNHEIIPEWFWNQVKDMAKGNTLQDYL